jgi:uncharacterized protein (DUF433 family)
MDPTGAYPADRAAALSAVPISTVHYWARTGVLVPSVSPERVKLWSYADLMGLRMIYWLRQSKEAPDGRDVPRTSMVAVRKALGALDGLDFSLWSEEHGPGVIVDRLGRILISKADHLETPDGAQMLDLESLDLVRPFDAGDARGPDLHTPRPSLRIVPGKLAGSPHIAQTRIETAALAALRARGLGADVIHGLYPEVEQAAIVDAVDLELQLTRNLKAAA